MMIERQLMEIARTIVRYYSPDRIILFGSYAKGSSKITSDIDLVIIRQTDEPPRYRGIFLKNLFSTSFTPLDIHFYTPEEFSESLADPYSFESRIMLSARVIYDKGG
jgi:predicted nucleotidyltransferase